MLALMTALPPNAPDPVWIFTRRLRIAGRAASVVWGIAVLGFLVCVTVRASTELQSALGVVASAFLAIGYALQAYANRIEQRAVDFADAQRRELISSTTRRR
jgi:hypothetical protein